MRWKDGKSTCSKCGNQHKNYYLKNRNIYKCSSCRIQFSLTQGTVFEKSKIPLKVWFDAIYIFTTKKNGISAIQLSKWLDVNQKTAWFILHRLREVLKNENESLLQGIVEADAACLFPDIDKDYRLYKKKKNHEAEQDIIHGKSNKKWIKGKKYYEENENSENLRVPFSKGLVFFGMAERDGKVVLKKIGVDDRSIIKNNIFPILQKHISSNSELITNKCNLYNETVQFFKKHETVNNYIAHVVDEIHINNVENVVKHLKSTIKGTYFHVSFKHFDRYLNEYTYRRNRKNASNKVLFEDFMCLISDKHITYSKLTK